MDETAIPTGGGATSRAGDGGARMNPEMGGAVPVAAAPPVAPAPFSEGELRRALYLPHRAIDLVLTERERWLATVAGRRGLAALVLAMVVTGGAFAVPYGLILGAAKFWQIAALYFGSVLICYPSLHVFSAFLGVRVRLSQSLALALLISTVAAIFSFGFFPVLWFLSVTMSQEASADTLQVISVLLLTVSLIAGVVQLARCLRADSPLARERGLSLLMFFWQCLLLFITYRMGLELGIV